MVDGKFNIYHFYFAISHFPFLNADPNWVWITPGSLTGTGLFICTSLGFKAYIINFGSYNATYGFIGSVIVLLL
jgi:membrane protein